MRFVTKAIILTSAFSGAAQASLSFNKDIRPILSDKCFACHGFDEETREAKLRLDTPEGAFKKRRKGAAIVPGKPDESLAWQLIITDDEDDVMPPLDSHKKMSDEEKAIIRQWIEEGAEYQKHWAFEAPVKGKVPTGEGSEIDRFVERNWKSREWNFLLRRIARP